MNDFFPEDSGKMNQAEMVEHAMRLRVQGYLNNVKSGLLLNTIYELNASKRYLRKLKNRLEDNNRELRAEIDRREEAEEKARQEEERRARFFSNVSHELRNPLNAILGFSQLIRFNLVEGGDSPESREEIRENNEVIFHATEYMVHLVNDLLDISSGNQAGLTAGPEKEFDLREELKIAASFFSRATAEKGIKLTLDASIGDTPVDYSGDPLRFRQVFADILAFLLNHTPADSEIRVDFFRNPEKLGVIARNQGKHLPPEELRLLTEPFERAATEYEFKGRFNPLGLPLSKMILEARGGELRASNLAEGGLELRVELPALPWFPE